LLPSVGCDRVNLGWLPGDDEVDGYVSERSEQVISDEMLRAAPTWTPTAVELSDLEMMLAGAFAPLTGFPVRTDLAAIKRTGRLADGRAWPVPLTLEVPSDMVRRMPVDGTAAIVLTDTEGAPVAVLTVLDAWPVREGWSAVGGPVLPYGDGGGGVFSRLRASTTTIHALLQTPRVLGIFADRPLHRPQLAQLAHAAKQLSSQVLIMIPIAGPTPDGLPAEALVRCVLAARDRIPNPVIVAVPLVKHPNEVTDALLRARVAAAYGATHLLSTPDALVGSGPRVLVPRELAYDSRDGQWRDREEVPEHFVRLAMGADEIAGLLDDGLQLPEWHTPPKVAKELSRARPPRRQRGLVLFFTGFSGSGKSTIARGVAEVIRERGDRTLTMLDGDVVRRELSAGLTFSKTDRDLNIRRIGWVAAEVGRHGGLAICCPIAPYEQARSAARAMARAAGADFVLVHVATPVEVCESRDRKGLYAQARAGLITGMTGVDDPYEEPKDAELRLDTTHMSVGDAVDAVLGYLDDEGWITAR
jgi:sulfate adenylyltransferase